MSWDEVKNEKEGYLRVRKSEDRALVGRLRKENDDAEAKGYIELNVDDLGGLGGSGGGPHTHNEYAPKTHTHDEYLTDLPDHDHPHTHPEYEGGEKYDDTELVKRIENDEKVISEQGERLDADERDISKNRQKIDNIQNSINLLSNDMSGKADIDHSHDFVGGEEYNDAELRGLIQDNTDKNEEQDGRLNTLEAGAWVNGSTIFYQNTNLNIYRDGVAGSPSPRGWQGWNYKSAGDSTKINWYIYDGNPEALTGQVNSIAFLVLPETTGTRLPHLSIYTMPQRDGQDSKPTYRSRLTYENTETSELKKNQPYVVYYGQDPKIFEHYPRVELTKADYTSQGPQGDDEVIQSIVVSSDSGATDGAYNFTLQQSQIDFTDYVENSVFLAPIIGNRASDEVISQLLSDVENLYTRLAELESDRDAGDGIHTDNG